MLICGNQDNAQALRAQGMSCSWTQGQPGQGLQPRMSL